MVTPKKEAATGAAKQAQETPPHPVPCVCAPCLNQQLDAASWRDRERLARKLVRSLSLEELRELPAETRRRLQDVLSAGCVSNADRRAVHKILAAELIEVEYQPRLTLKGPQDFIEKTRSHLDQIAATRTGKKLLRSLRRSGRAVRIVPASRVSEAPPDNYRGALAKGTALRWRDRSGKLRSIKGDGTGSDTMIKYDPDRVYSSLAEAWRKQPPAIGLAHELIHADDAAYGRMDPDKTDGVWNFERQAIGLPPFEQKEFTENKFRAEWAERQPARPRY